MNLSMTKPTKGPVCQEPGHPASLVRVLAVRMKKAWVLSYPFNAQRRLRSDYVHAQTGPGLRRAHMPFCWFCRAAAMIINEHELSGIKKI